MMQGRDFYNGRQSRHGASRSPSYNGQPDQSPLREKDYERERLERYQRSRLETETALLKYANIDKREHSPAQGYESSYLRSTAEGSYQRLSKYDIVEQKDDMRGVRNFEKKAYKDSYPIRCVSTENLHKSKKCEYQGWMADVKRSQQAAVQRR